MRNYLIFNHKNIADFGVYISGSGTFTAPKRDIETVSVPGRSGDLTMDNGRYNNITISYPCFIYRNFAKDFDNFRAFLMSNIGYKRLEDTYHPDEFRMGFVASNLDPKVGTLNRSGEFDLDFECMPQRFLRLGEETISFEEDATIVNPTMYEAAPLIRVYGSGILGIGNNTITISDVEDYVDIDCDIQDAYYGSFNYNSHITLNSGAFPKFEPGTNGISIGSGITRVDIKPRWWTL